jgi:Yme1-like, N-terminal
MLLTRQGLLDKYPEYVVKRYESGSVATNPACDRIYRLALERLGRHSYSPQSFRNDAITLPQKASTSFPYHISDSHAGQTRQTGSGPLLTGVKGNPVHVVLDEGMYIVSAC